MFEEQATRSINHLIDNYQRRRLSASGGLKAADGTSDLDDLKRKVASLEIANQAMFEFLQSRFDIGESDILKKMEEIDLRDGNFDGKPVPAVVLCPQCGRNSSESRSTCVYCGAALSVIA